MKQLEFPWGVPFMFFQKCTCCCDDRKDAPRWSSAMLYFFMLIKRTV